MNNNKTKYIFVTGGVVSSLGKGIVSASLASILKENNYNVFIQKFDPYLNIDPGTMSPLEHGEVFVTSDGAETDLDLGHYERFLGIELNKHSSITSGRIYYDLITSERRGELNGKTAQVVPHITDAIKNKIKMASVKSQTPYDVVITEIGGTIGDIESQPFIEAIRQLKMEQPDNVMFIHMTLLPYLKTTNELKTKPTQQSIRLLNSFGIIPDIIVLRSEKKIEQKIKDKISAQTSILSSRILVSEDVDNIYNIPLMLHEQKIGNIVKDILKLELPISPTLKKWEKFEKELKTKPTSEILIGIVGKYTELPDAYLSIIKSLELTGYKNNVKINIELISAEDINSKNAKNKLEKLNGIIVPGGFGKRAIEGKIASIKFVRENDIPFLGICLGMQLATIEYARNVLELKDANSTEFDPKTTNPIFKIMKEDEQIGGTLRLGDYEAKLKKGTLVHKVYKEDIIKERHRHRYEFNNDYLNRYDDNFIFSGINPQNNLVEFIEIKNHKFFIATQSHPEFKTYVGKISPLFNEFINSILK